jgi:hypothetical protein
VLRERGILPERAGEGGRALWNDAVPFVGLLGILGAWTVFVSTNGNSSVTENYLLPAGYEGPVVVVFDQENGAPAEQEGTERIYRIPNDGVLFTQFPSAGGYRAKFWYEDEEGERTEIPVVNSSCRAESADSPIFACNQSSLKFTNGRTILAHRAYIVGYEEEMPRYANRLTAIIDNVLWPLSEEP